MVTMIVTMIVTMMSSDSEDDGGESVKKLYLMFYMNVKITSISGEKFISSKNNSFIFFMYKYVGSNKSVWKDVFFFFCHLNIKLETNENGNM